MWSCDAGTGIARDFSDMPSPQTPNWEKELFFDLFSFSPGHQKETPQRS
jgi:hypothetical protein